MVAEVTIRSDWMKACGKGHSDVTAKVVFEYPTRLPDGTRMFDVVLPSGEKWTVAEWRCR